MDRKRLEAYRSEKQEIIELREKLANLKVENYTGNDVIMDYRSGFPVPQSVVGTDTAAYYARQHNLTFEINRLEKRCQEVETWINEIQDSQTRRIFRMYFEDGKRQQDIARTLHMDQSRVSRRIEEYLKEI